MVFIGAKADLFTYKVGLETVTLNIEPRTSMIFIPSLQTGYMILINDMFLLLQLQALDIK